MSGAERKVEGAPAGPANMSHVRAAVLVLLHVLPSSSAEDEEGVSQAADDVASCLLLRLLLRSFELFTNPKNDIY